MIPPTCTEIELSPVSKPITRKRVLIPTLINTQSNWPRRQATAWFCYVAAGGAARMPVRTEIREPREPPRLPSATASPQSASRQTGSPRPTPITARSPWLEAPRRPSAQRRLGGVRTATARAGPGHALQGPPRAPALGDQLGSLGNRELCQTSQGYGTASGQSLNCGVVHSPLTIWRQCRLAATDGGETRSLKVLEIEEGRVAPAAEPWVNTRCLLRCWSWLALPCGSGWFQRSAQPR